MYIKFVSPWDSREFKLCRVTDGTIPTLGGYDSPDELPEIDDDEFVEYEGKRVKYAEFKPHGSHFNQIIATSGEIFIQDDSGSTIERVR